MKRAAALLMLLVFASGIVAHATSTQDCTPRLVGSIVFKSKKCGVTRYDYHYYPCRGYVKITPYCGRL